MAHTESEPNKHNSSTEVSFSVVHHYVNPLVGDLVNIPMLGTPAWHALDDDDELKLAAVLDGGQHWALHLELRQLALIEASKYIAGVAEWKAVARELQDLNTFRAANPWARRVAS